MAELEPPKDGKTSCDFRYIDPTLDDFMKATAGHPVILNFSTIPAWMWKRTEPVKYPEDPNQVFWTYTQDTEMLINKRLRTAQVVLPAGMDFSRITYVAPSTGDDPPVQRKMTGTTVELEPNEVAVLSQ